VIDIRRIFIFDHLKQSFAVIVVVNILTIRTGPNRRTVGFEVIVSDKKHVSSLKNVGVIVVVL
jgi:hypothetical protein